MFILVVDFLRVLHLDKTKLVASAKTTSSKGVDICLAAFLANHIDLHLFEDE